jgi:hypothetical protein
LALIIVEKGQAFTRGDIGERTENMKSGERGDGKIFLNLQGNLLTPPEDGGLVYRI